MLIIGTTMRLIPVVTVQVKGYMIVPNTPGNANTSNRKTMPI